MIVGRVKNFLRRTSDTRKRSRDEGRTIVTDTVLYDGFYASGPRKWEEWHAGVRMHGVRFYYMRYYANGDWVYSYRDQPFDFWAFTEAMTPDLLALAKRGSAPMIGDYDPSCSAGTFTIHRDTLFESSSFEILRGQTRIYRRTIKGEKLVSVDSKDKPLVLKFYSQPATSRWIKLRAALSRY